MNDSSSGEFSNLPQSEYTAEQLLTKLLELIIASAEPEQLTRQAVEEKFGLKLPRVPDVEGDVYGHRAQLTPEWAYTLDTADDEIDGPAVSLDFSEIQSEADPDMTDICGVDSQAFASFLQAAGFERNTVYLPHGRLGGDIFNRGSVRVSTAVRGEASEPTEKITHLCIQSVYVSREPCQRLHDD